MEGTFDSKAYLEKLQAEITARATQTKGKFYIKINGKLLKDEALYKDLDKSAKQLELLLQDLRLNPKRYLHFSVFGKKAKVYEPNDVEKAE